VSILVSAFPSYTQSQFEAAFCSVLDCNYYSVQIQISRLATSSKRDLSAVTWRVIFSGDDLDYVQSQLRNTTHQKTLDTIGITLFPYTITTLTKNQSLALESGVIENTGTEGFYNLRNIVILVGASIVFLVLLTIVLVIVIIKYRQSSTEFISMDTFFNKLKEFERDSSHLDSEEMKECYSRNSALDSDDA